MGTWSKRHALGQHFLQDSKIAYGIASRALELASQTGSEALLEIGPGKGAITHPILELNQAREKPLLVVLSEKDRVFAANWKQREESGLQVDEGDFLDLPESAWLKHAPLTVASNLPYSSGTAILLRLAKHRLEVRAMVLMFQAEVAQRLRAVPGNKDWGSLSLWIQNEWEVKKLFSVPPRAFRPPPKVDSEVVELLPREKPLLPLTEHHARSWESLLKVCFAHRRKMLRSGLPKTGPWQNALARSGLDGTKRAEALSWEEWGRLLEALVEESKLSKA